MDVTLIIYSCETRTLHLFIMKIVPEAQSILIGSTTIKRKRQWHTKHEKNDEIEIRRNLRCIKCIFKLVYMSNYRGADQLNNVHDFRVSKQN